MPVVDEGCVEVGRCSFPSRVWGRSCWCGSYGVRNGLGVEAVQRSMVHPHTLVDRELVEGRGLVDDRARIGLLNAQSFDAVVGAVRSRPPHASLAKERVLQ